MRGTASFAITSHYVHFFIKIIVTMRSHTMNLFRVENLHELNFSYRLVQFDLPVIVGKEDHYNTQVNKIDQKGASLIGGPAAIVKRADAAYIAIPADRKLEDTKVDVVPLKVALKLLP